MAYISPLLAPHFVATKSEKDIAERLREDEALINAGKPCSWIVWHLPGYNTDKGKAIATYLASAPDLSHNIKSIIYENKLNRIRRFLRDEGRSRTVNGVTQETKIGQEILHQSELSTALKVLVHLQETAAIQQNTQAEAIISLLEERVAPQAPGSQPLEDGIFLSSKIPKPPLILRKRLCYICRLALTNPHPSQPSMCIPCGAFNLSSSLLSTPPKLSFPPTFTALVTGARINLGYHTALRLLRCGARVIASTRYPRDAIVRYLDESDHSDWKDRLRVVGADFRSAADAFALVHETKRCLREWADGGEGKLSLLINNAAQTLTDSVKKEERAMKREDALLEELASEGLLIEGTYKVKVRGGAAPMALEGTISSVIPREVSGANSEAAGTSNALHALNGAATAEMEPYIKSSWVQSLFDIPYEDVMSAHAVNTFVPLILCRELLPLMGCANPATSPSTTQPQAYIINVSSREGIFEDRTNSKSKRGKHVHTNMSKAALNMITETEAAAAWQSRRIAMNTVDPGYMSAAPEYENAFDGVRPIGWEDGAGRVLWPIAVGEIEGQAIWGRFLKHYGAVEVDPGAGRG